MKRKLTSIALVSAMVTSSAVNALALEERNSSKTKSALEKIKSEKKELLSENKNLNDTINENEIKINQTKTDLQSVLNQKIENEKELSNTQVKLEEEVQNLKQQMVNFYMSSYSSNVSILKELISSENASDFIITTSHLKYIVNDRDKKVDDVSKLLEKHKELSKKISDSESKLVSLQNELIENQKKLEKESSDNKQRIAALNKKEDELEDILVVQEKEEAEIKQAILNSSIQKQENETTSNKVETPNKIENSATNNSVNKENVENENSNSMNNNASDNTISNNTSNNTVTPSGALQRPVASYRITSRFGMRNHPVTGVRKMHNGIDLAAPKGTPILSCQSGKVIISQYSSSYGNYIVVDHGGGISTLYAHLDSRYANVGDSVKCGQQIGTMGSTGMSTGPHLHFEVRVNGEKVNPESHISF